MTTPVKVLGIFEAITFPEFGNLVENAKIDTGAYSGALHCTKIREAKLKGKPVLKFSPFDHPEFVATAHNFRVREVMSSNGMIQKRYFIHTLVRINKKNYPIELSLADRSRMRMPVLIGRRFISENNFLVDVNKITKVS